MGCWDRATAQLKIAVTTSSLQEFQPLLSAMGQSALPVEFNGRASFNGTLSGKLAHPDIAGRLLAYGLHLCVHASSSATASQPRACQRRRITSCTSGKPHPSRSLPTPEARRIHIDSFAGDIAVRQDADRAAQRRDRAGHCATERRWLGTLVTDGGFNANTPFELRASIHNGSVADLQRTIGTDYPVSGMVNFTVQASGTQN